MDVDVDVAKAKGRFLKVVSSDIWSLVCVNDGYVFTLNISRFLLLLLYVCISSLLSCVV